jgi:hypothetical protein
MEQLEIAGFTVTITPIPAVPMLRLTRRMAAALAAQKMLVATGASVAQMPASVVTSDTLLPEHVPLMLGFVEQVIGALDGALLDDFLVEAGKQVVINNVRGKEAFAVFDGNLIGLMTVLYHVLRISGFSHTLREKS